VAADVSLPLRSVYTPLVVPLFVLFFPRLLECTSGFSLTTTLSRYGEDKELTEGYVKDLWE
jgi:hypothetical protein